jgi:acetyl-CoA acetyltransferase
VTFGSQTHPADANAGIIVCNRGRAGELSKDGVIVELLAYGEARVEKGFMPAAVAPAARDALKHAGLTASQVDVFKTHNPFAVNDVLFCREFDLAPERVNNYGSPLVYGHPQAPMGMRVVIELCEELVLRGGGVGLFSGCAAGDSAMALVVRVSS